MPPTFVQSLMPFAFWGTLIAIPGLIVLLYFLKLRRQPVEVPSTYLWTRTIEDLHVNSIWQKLRRSILLFLQVLFAILVILACLPWASIFETLGINWRIADPLDERIVILIDNSASMSATDEGETRLEIAKTRAEELVDRMTNENAAMIITFSDEADVVQGFTRDRALLKKKIRRIQPTERTSVLEEALRAASGLANPGRTSEVGDVNDVQVADALPATLYLFSDGGVRNVPEFSLGNLQPKYVPIGNVVNPNNLGIVMFSAGENKEVPGQYQAFARIQNSTTIDAEAEVVLTVNGEEWDRAKIDVPAEDDRSLNFDLLGIFDRGFDSANIRVELIYDDDLALDNVAYAVLNRPRPGRVLLVTEGNPPFDMALSTQSLAKHFVIEVDGTDVLAEEEHKTRAATGFYDLIIYDECTPESMPQANTLFIGSIPKADGWTMGEPEFPVIVIDTNQAHPMMQLVELRSVVIVEGSSLEGPSGTLSLVDSNIGSIMAIGPRAGFEDVVIGFPMYVADEDGNRQPNSDWQRNLSFPVFVHNVLDYLAGANRFIETGNVQPGKQVRLQPAFPVDEISVFDPDQKRTRLSRDRRSNFIFHDSEQIGIYDVREGNSDEVTQRFVVNLFDPRESDLRVRDTMVIGHDDVTGVRDWQTAFPKLWKWILGLGLIILMAEWYIYNKRVYL